LNGFVVLLHVLDKDRNLFLFFLLKMTVVEDDSGEGIVCVKGLWILVSHLILTTGSYFLCKQLRESTCCGCL